MFRKIIIALGLLFLFVSNVFHLVYAQEDSPISYRFDLPLLINPANAGRGGSVFSENESDHSFKINYKNQMSNAFSSNSLKIISGSYEGRFFNKQMAIGLDVYSNTLNNSALQDLSVMLSYAYHWTVDKDVFGDPTHLLSFGVQAGLRHWAIDLEELRTNSMYDPSYAGGFNPSLIPEYLANDNSKNMFDLQFGINYFGTIIDDALFLDLGVSAWHLNRPKSNFLDDNGRVSVKWVSYAAITYRTGVVDKPTGSIDGIGSSNSGVWEASLSALFINQGAKNLLELSALGRYYFSGDFSIGLGLAYRTLSFSDVFSPFISLDICSFNLNFQVDLYPKMGGAFNNLFAIGLGYRF